MKLSVGIREIEYAEGKMIFDAVSDAKAFDVSHYNLREHQIKKDAATALRFLPKALQDELLLIGAIEAASRYACEYKNRNLNWYSGTAAGKAAAAERKAKDDKRSREARVRHETRAEKVKAFDRIVELLDHHDVNGKPLGDCRRADLLRAATANVMRAEELSVNAALYKQLAGMVGDGTVREYRDRAGVVALLTTTFGEQ